MAKYEVIARKWRPGQFADVVGQDHVTQTLKNAIESKRLAHAYLFVGPRGIGKTSIARILAKALNCEKGPTPVPCGTCDSCREVAAGNSLDVMEIDGASNNGVEQVRDLRDTVKYAPTRGAFKIYIIDEVHMLSSAAFNALLKTLEEPPEHVKFIFATTEPQKILATIVSRCQRFDLRRISVPAIVERLALIADSEKVKVSADALLAIARGAEGGLRDAESALDQLIAFKGDTIDEADVLSVFGLVSRQALESAARQVIEGDIKGLIHLVAEIDEAGKDLQRFTVELMEHFRRLLICSQVDDPARVLELTAAQVESMKKQAGLTHTDNLLRVIAILTETEERMRFALSRRTLLETALIRGARMAAVASLETILADIQRLKAGGVAGLPAAPDTQKKSNLTVSPPSEGGAMHPERSPAQPSLPPLLEPERTDLSPPSVAKRREAAPQAEPHSGTGTADLEKIREKWDQVLAKAGSVSIRARRLLIDAFPIGINGDRVQIGFDSEFADEIEIIRGGAREREALESGLHSVLRRKVTFELVPSDSHAISEMAHGARENQPRADEAVPPAGGGNDAEEKKTGGRSRKELLEDPTVMKTLEAFNGSVTDVRS